MVFRLISAQRASPSLRTPRSSYRASGLDPASHRSYCARMCASASGCTSAVKSIAASSSFVYPLIDSMAGLTYWNFLSCMIQIATEAVSATARNFSSLSRSASSACFLLVMSRTCSMAPVTSPLASRSGKTNSSSQPMISPCTSLNGTISLCIVFWTIARRLGQMSQGAERP
ncbi:MAG: hypothetical protein A4E28_01380 [Methanocella sp. PtaU1.Bin125]|nr:MAG: hypothetical protein A4E28_01380 [Methanocella sp. PtaU1.Bin125]